MLTDAVQRYGGLMLRYCVLFPGKELIRATVLLGVSAASLMVCFKTSGEHYRFLPFFMKADVLFRFLLVSKNQVLT